MNPNRRHLYLLIDTETANSINNPLCYNIAWCIIDQYGNVYAQGNFINADVFYGMIDLMQSAYYADKIPQYHEQIMRKEIEVVSWYEIRKALCDMCAKYNVRAIIAHNARFDYRSCTTTQRYETCSKYRYFFPKGIEIWDTLTMARDVIAPMASYQKFCNDNGYVCKNGRPRLTAEILYRFITNNPDFEEAHKAMEDVEIEREIFWYCIRKHQKMNRLAFKKK